MKKITAAIIGASGYTGEELMRLLLRHPMIELVAATSRQYIGKRIVEIYPHLVEAGTLTFTAPELTSINADVFFLAMPHGEAIPLVESLLKTGKKIIDLSADFRLKDRNRFVEYYNAQPASQTLLNLAVYGNPELYSGAITQTQFIASPGCYPTSILLALAPLLKENKIKTDAIIINSLSGVSGAGRKADLSLLFAECDENVKPYSVAHHRHIPEIEQELSRVANQQVTVQFTPHLLPVRRGISTSIVVEPRDKKNLPTQQEVDALYSRFYDKKPFVRILNRSLPEIKHVAFSNRCDIAVRVDARTSRLLIFSALDNLTKGAGGQAIQCLNLMMGWDETEGLPR